MVGDLTYGQRWKSHPGGKTWLGQWQISRGQCESCGLSAVPPACGTSLETSSCNLDCFDDARKQYVQTLQLTYLDAPSEMALLVLQNTIR